MAPNLSLKLEPCITYSRPTTVEFFSLVQLMVLGLIPIGLMAYIKGPKRSYFPLNLFLEEIYIIAVCAIYFSL